MSASLYERHQAVLHRAPLVMPRLPCPICGKALRRREWDPAVDWLGAARECGFLECLNQHSFPAYEEELLRQQTLKPRQSSLWGVSE